MPWKKMGLIYAPDGTKRLGRTHASLPVPIQIEECVYRVFFASRDDRNYSHIWSVDIELSLENAKVLSGSTTPLLEPGPIGHFDDCGVYPASIIKVDGTLLLYYIGWVTGATYPVFYTNVGLAVSEDNGESFERYSSAPIIGRDEIDPWMVTSSFVLAEETSYKMWYVGGSHWDNEISPWQSYYQIKYAESVDGFRWNKTGDVCIPLAEGEHNISRACVISKSEEYEAWFGVNAGQGYRLGYAKSKNGLDWLRCDEEIGICLSDDGWDSDAQSYPYVVDCNLGRFMFYNGNNFGKSGFGLAKYE
jgi:hypothetical protein